MENLGRRAKSAYDGPSGRAPVAPYVAAVGYLEI